MTVASTRRTGRAFSPGAAAVATVAALASLAFFAACTDSTIGGPDPDRASRLGPNVGGPQRALVAPGPNGCVTTAATTSPWNSVAFSSTRTGLFDAVVEATPLAGAIDAGVSLSHGVQTDFAGLAVIARFNTSGVVDARNGAAYQADSVFHYSAGTTYLVHFVVDVRTHRYSVYVAAKGGAEHAIATNYAFRSEQATVTSLDTHTVFADVSSLRACRLGDGGVVAPPGGTWRTTTLQSGAQTGTFTVEWDAVPSRGDLDGVMGLSTGAQSTFAGYATLVRFNTSGTIDARNGAAYAADRVVHYGVDSMYHFRLAVDVPNHRYDVFVTPQGGAEQTLARAYAFRSEQQQVTKLDTFGAIVDVSAGTVAASNVVATRTGTDCFGTRMLYPTVAGGKTWCASWNNGHARSFGFADDPDDRWFHGRGNGTYSIDGNGVLTASGANARLYVFDPAYPGSGEPDPSRVMLWRDVEVTWYQMRVSDSSVAYAGAVAGAKIRHIPDTELCGTRGYYGRLRNDGDADFDKEISHPNSVSDSLRHIWSGFPFNQWVGVKYVLRDSAGRYVKMELWRDLTGGASGGTWQLVDQAVDTGGWGSGATPCAAGVDPTQIMTGAYLSVLLRNDAVATARYRQFSIREIAAH